MSSLPHSNTLGGGAGVRQHIELKLLSVSAASRRHLVMRWDPSDYSEQQSVTNSRLDFCTEMTKEWIIKHPEVINPTKTQCCACNWFSLTVIVKHRKCACFLDILCYQLVSNIHSTVRCGFLLDSLYFKSCNVAHFIRVLDYSCHEGIRS